MDLYWMLLMNHYIERVSWKTGTNICTSSIFLSGGLEGIELKFCFSGDRGRGALVT